MDISVKNIPLNKINANLLVIPFFEDELKKTGYEKIDALIRSSFNSKEFTGDLDDVLLFRNINIYGFKNLAFIGLGEKDNYGGYEIRTSFAYLAKEIGKMGLTSMGLFFDNTYLNSDVCLKDFILGVFEGFFLGSYKFDKYKTKKKSIKLPKTFYLCTKTKIKENIGSYLKKAYDLSCVTNFSRDLTNEPSMYLTPSKLAQEAEKIRGVKVQTLGRVAMIQLGMNGILSVSRGSEHEPKLISLFYKPKKKTNKTIALLGKGITFDSGGLNIKPVRGMAIQKTDMAGAASVLGIFKYINEIKPNINVIGLIGACENMPDAKAYKPADIIRFANNKTVEVINTDAEGRLVLADLLCYAEKLGAKTLIDLSTLTGHILVALGEEIAGIFGNDKKLVNSLIDHGKKSGEDIWELPLFYRYRETLKSITADMKNVGQRLGGSITASLFLKEFIPKNTSWAHIDIAGAAYTEKGFGYHPKGATGFGVRTILRYLEEL